MQDLIKQAIGYRLLYLHSETREIAGIGVGKWVSNFNNVKTTKGCTSKGLK